jgi:hypothetical protein
MLGQVLVVWKPWTHEVLILEIYVIGPWVNSATYGAGRRKLSSADALEIYLNKVAEYFSL